MVVIIGILAAIAIPKFANTKEKAVLASMKSDLRNLVTAQEGFFSDNQDYATALGADPGQRRGGLRWYAWPSCPSADNVLAVTRHRARLAGRRRSTNATAQGRHRTTCGIYVGIGVAPNGRR